jgi:hypothetical protein
MLAPGSVFTSGRVDITAGAAQTPDFFFGGFGFMSDGSLAVDTGAVSGTRATKGIAQSAAGAIYGTTSRNASDVYLEGVRISISGQLVYESAAATGYSSRNPVTSNNAFGVT